MPDFFHYLSYNTRGNSECHWIGNILTEFQAHGQLKDFLGYWNTGESLAISEFNLKNNL